MNHIEDVGIILSALVACRNLLDPIVEQLPDEQLGQVQDAAQEIARMCSEAWWEQERPIS